MNRIKNHARITAAHCERKAEKIQQWIIKKQNVRLRLKHLTRPYDKRIKR